MDTSAIEQMITDNKVLSVQANHVLRANAVSVGCAWGVRSGSVRGGGEEGVSVQTSV